MDKTTKIVLATLGGAFLLCCGGGAILVFGGVQGYKGIEVKVVKEGDAIVESVCRTWDQKALLARSTPEFKSTPKAELEGIIKIWSSEYGTYQGGKGKMIRFNTQTSTGAGTSTMATYVNDATFSKGPAKVTLHLLRRGSGPWEVNSLRVSR